MSVKRNLFIQHLATHSCFLKRHGGNHDIYQNIVTKKKTALPRHSTIDRHLGDRICKQLEIPKM